MKSDLHRSTLDDCHRGGLNEITPTPANRGGGRVLTSSGNIRRANHRR